MKSSPTIAVPQILTIGLVALDVLVRRDSSAAETFAFRAGGTAGNVASILGALGWTAYTSGPHSQSLAFDLMVDDLRQCGVHYHAARQAAVPIIVEDLDEQLPHRFSFRCPNCGYPFPRYERAALAADEHLFKWAQESDVFFADRLSSDVLALAAAARERGAFIVYEPSDPDDEPWVEQMLAIASMVKCSSERARQLSWLSTTENCLDIRTNGADGLCWRWPALGIARWRSMSGAPTGRIVDSCGAGDWLTAGILVGIRGLGWPDGVPAVERILRQAQGLAAWSCGFAGAKGALYEAGPSAARRHAGGETRDATATAVDPLLERAMDASQCCVSCSPSPSWSARPAF